MIEPIVVGLLRITHPHASARVRALRGIEGVEVVAAGDDDPALAVTDAGYRSEQANGVACVAVAGE